MHWKVLSKYSTASFKRATGVSKDVFLELVQIVTDYKRSIRKNPVSGSKSILSIEDTILMMLMYYREYRTQFHIGICYGLSESRVCELIKETEQIIISDKRYHLPGKKQLLKLDNGIETALIDVSECAIERPKKSKDATIQARKNDIHKKHS
jgi:hypothetical protein